MGARMVAGSELGWKHCSVSAAARAASDIGQRLG